MNTVTRKMRLKNAVLNMAIMSAYVAFGYGFTLLVKWSMIA